MEGYNKNILDNDTKQLPLVSICSITYNHAPFIRQCLDGFLMQKTNFKYEIIIHDDASTDGTTEIIKEYAKKYPDLITPIFQTENQYSKGIRGFYAKFVFPHAKGKYIAMCEGDDYWINPLKLQKQVDFLETHSDYVICSHNFKVYHEEKRTFIIDSYYDNYSKGENSTYTLDDYFNLWYTQPLSCVFRNDSYLKKIPYKKYKYFRDSIFFYYILKEGKGILMPEIMGVYRKHNNGIYSGVSKKFNQYIKVYNFKNIYLVEKDTKIFSEMNKAELEYIYWMIAEDGKLKALIELFKYITNTPISISSKLIYRLMKNYIK